MRSYFKTIIYLITISFSLLSCSSHNDDAWDIIAAGLPKNVTTAQASINMGLYILKQTHEPLFRYKKRTELYSNLLESWSRNLENTNFRFCLKKNLAFSEQEDFNLLSFELFLKKILVKYKITSKIRKKDYCLEISFAEVQTDFLNLLTKYENAPSSSSDGKNWHDGLGHFKITSLSEKKISLTRKKSEDGGYNAINFWAYSGKSDPILRKGGIEDYNRVLLSDFPRDKVKDFQKFNVALLQTVNLVLNIQDQTLRKNIFNCLDIHKLRKAFMPKQKSFLDVGSILPIGIPESVRGKVKQKCNSSSLSDKSIAFHNWNSTSQSTLKEYFKELQDLLGLKINIINITMNQLVDMVFISPHPYEMTIVALDAVDVNYDAYFSPIIDDKSIIDIRSKKLISLYNKFKATKDVSLVKEITSGITRKHLILPLYQEVRDFYFPKHIKSLTIGKDDLEYLEISELRL